MQYKRVLVTGGAGFISSNFTDTLSTNNEVFVVDNEYLGTFGNLHPSVSFYEQSILEEDLPTDVDVVFHLAALSSHAMHENDPQHGA
jgi:UDP-glucose 4-epimerase